MKKILNILLLSVFNLAIICCTCFFIIRPGINILKDGLNIKVLTDEEVRIKKDEIIKKYDIKSKELVEYINKKQNDINIKYKQIEDEVSSKYKKEMMDDGWYEEQVEKSKEIRRVVTDPKTNEEMALFSEQHSKERELDQSKEDEISKISNNSKKRFKTILKGSGICIGGVLIIIILISKIVNIFNKLISSKNKVGESWAQVDVQLKKRYDLIPNIVEIVKGYTKHEKTTLESIVKIRSEAMNNKDINRKIELNKDISSSLQRIIALKEDYPELKADKSYLALQNNLEIIENDLSRTRSIYNESVLRYKNIKDTFPNNMFASIFGFKDASYFEANEEERKNISIKL